MTQEELEKIETSMTKEQIVERAKTLRPVKDLKKAGCMRFWVDGGRIHTQSYTWSIKRLKPTGYLRELGRITTFHKCGHPSLFKPSVDECVYQCPFPEATAFQVVSGGDYNYDLNRHEAETVYYVGDMPEDIKNREIEW